MTSSYINSLNTKKLDVVLREINAKLEKEGILKDRLTLDIWTKLMSYLMQGEYDLALPIRTALQNHMLKQRQDKMHIFKSLIQRLDEILDRHIPAPELGTSKDSDNDKTNESKKNKQVSNVVVPEQSLVHSLHSKPPEPSEDKLSEETTAKIEVMHVRQDIETKPRSKSKPADEVTREEFYLLKANESILKKTVEDQQMKIKRLQETADSLERHNMALKEDMLSISSKQDGKISVCSKAEKEIKYLRKELEIKERSLEMSMLERSGLLDSAVTAAKFTSSNTSLADIIDMNRPTKMAEKHSDLYRNEWADAFYALTFTRQYDKKTAIMLLLDILQDSYAFCEETTLAHTQTLVQDTMNPFRGQSEMKGTESYQLDEVGMTIVSNLKKVTAGETVAHVQVQFMKNMQRSNKKGYDETTTRKWTPYIDKCVELCWFMVIQTPPLCLDDDHQVKSGEYLDRDMYTFYTAPGSKIDYIVWPTLFLSQNGIVLSKGVAQAKQEGVALRISSSRSRESIRTLDKET